MIAAMVVDHGQWRDNTMRHQVEVMSIAAGVGRMDCPECEGTGDWTRFHPNPHGSIACVDCKGTGKVLVSI